MGFEMAKTSLMKSALSAAFVAAIGLSTPAHALDPKQCGTRAEILTELKNEGQVDIIGGNRAALGSPRNIFTSNADGTLGYNIEAGVDSEAGMLCVGAKYTDIRLNNDPNFARPTWARAGANSANDRLLDRIEREQNAKVIMGAVPLIRGADGNERRGTFLMVTRGDAVVNGDTSSGSGYVRSSAGLSTFIIIRNVEPNANFASLAKRPVQTAALALRSPN